MLLLFPHWTNSLTGQLYNLCPNDKKLKIAFQLIKYLILQLSLFHQLNKQQCSKLLTVNSVENYLQIIMYWISNCFGYLNRSYFIILNNKNAGWIWLGGSHISFDFNVSLLYWSLSRRKIKMEAIWIISKYRGFLFDNLYIYRFPSLLLKN